MDELNSRDLQRIHRVVTQALSETKLTPLWQRLHNEYGIGRISGKNLKLSKEDCQRVREITRPTGHDVMFPLPTGSRLEISKYSGNEKLLSEAPGRHHLLLNSATGLLRLNDTQIPLSLGSSYRCDWRELELETVTSVIVVENLQPFDYIQQAQLPDELKNAWVLYRGHNESTKAVIDLLNTLPENCLVIGFADYDPAGFKILLTGIPRITHCLLPDLSKNLFILAKGTQNRFYKQQKEIAFIENSILPSILNHYWKKLEPHKVCVSQELIFSQKIKLRCGKLIFE
jgi:hypothetical protein